MGEPLDLRVVEAGMQRLNWLPIEEATALLAALRATRAALTAARELLTHTSFDREIDGQRWDEWEKEAAAVLSQVRDEP